MEQEQPDLRQSPREAVALAASALSLDRSRSVIISDLSAEGALLDGRDLPTPGEDVLMVVGSQDAFARVVWRTSEKAGVRFEEAISYRNLVQMKTEAEWTSAAGWWR